MMRHLSRPSGPRLTAGRRAPGLNRPGFTLVELVVVVGIGFVALALLLVGIQRVRESANAVRCASNLRHLALACHTCHELHDRMPPAWDWFPADNVTGGSCGIGPFFFHLLPYVEQDNLYRGSRRQVSGPGLDYYDHQLNANTAQVRAYSCPLDPTLPARAGAPGVLPYAGSSYATNADFTYRTPFGRPNLSLSFPDGVSNTILFGEKYASADIRSGPQANAPYATKGGCHWAYWGDNVYSAFFALYMPEWTDRNSIGPVAGVAGDTRDSRFQVRPRLTTGHVNPSLCATGHRAGMNVSMADGSVRTLAAGMDRHVWWAAVTPAAGNGG